GRFSIRVSDNATLLITASGFEALTASAGAASFRMVRREGNLNEVVVTALGIRRSRNTLPYAAQQVTGEEVSQSRGSNFVNALSGRVSGVEIRQGNGMGSSTNIVIRGTKSLLNSNQAMFVIDGVPVDNSNTTNAATATGRVNDVNNRPIGGYDYGNAAADINPDDIESLTVLKGAAATALYGSRAANGVVMITTKKGRKGLGITVNSGITVGKIDKSTFVKYQKEYGAGYSQSGYSTPASGTPNTGFWFKDAFGTGTMDLIVPTTEDASYGIRFDPNLLVYHWNAFDPTSPYYRQKRPWVAAQNDPSTFYETAVSNNNNILLTGGGDQATFKLGYTRSEEKGILPNSKLLKNLVNFGANYNILDNLTASASVNFSRIDGKGRFGTGYNKYNVNQSFRQWYQANVDMMELKEAYFRNQQNITWNWADPTKASGLKPIYMDNPYFVRYQNYQTDNRNRYFGNVALNFKATSWLNILGRISLDSYDELHEERIAVGSVGVPAYSQFNHTFRELNYDLIANVDQNLSADVNLKALLGTNLRRTTNLATYATTNGGLVVPKLYALSNSVNPLNVLPTDETAERIAVDGYFAGITLGYREFLTLDATARVDRASTLPVNNNTYWYPSVSGSFAFSKLLPTATWLSLGKVRLNYAEVGNSAPWGSTSDIYFKPAAFGSTTLFSLPDIKNNPELVPERTKSYEAGLEMAMFRNRLGFDVTYYSTKSVDQIFPVAVSNATGYTSKFVNAGTIQNRGVELSLYGSPVRTQNFSWNVNVNWTRNRNKVLELFDKSTNLQINPLNLQGGVSINATLGQPYGTIQGKTWVRHDNGGKLVGANGLYVLTTTTNNVIGNINPDWVGGISNSFRYKNLSLGFLVDVRQGGDVFSLDLYYGMATGIYPETAGLNDLGNPKRAPLTQGGGVIYEGVTADGKANTKRVDITTYGAYGYVNNPAAAFVYDASFVKLREANLTYTLPQSLFRRATFVKGIDLSIIGRNLWIIHKNLPYADPEENITSGNIQGYQSGAYPTTRTVGFNARLRF
ncbi:MAG: SusC/RagA family TonB-linked outer membrane protein, partial [Bacteroidota bacterium]|nr:SusC/RagA family TonB-linked outer membrane protein [Bacteroidota bacterium]